MVVFVISPAACPAAALEVTLHCLYSGPVPPHNLPYIGDPVEIFLQLVNLPQYLMEPRDLRIGGFDQVVCAVVLCLGKRGALLAQVFDPALHLAHQTVEVPRELGQGRAVKQQHALTGGSAGGARGARTISERSLSLTQQLDFLRCQT